MLMADRENYVRNRRVLLEKIAGLVHDRDVRDAEEKQQGRPPPRRLKVGIDANLLGFKYVNSKKSLEPDEAVWKIAKAFSEKLIDVVIICDHPTNRHSSKRASCRRRANAEKDAIKLIVAKAQLQSQLRFSNEKDTETRALQKQIQSLEKASKRQLPPTFAANLQDFVARYDSDGKGEVSIIERSGQSN
jgi:hypothetical protein